MLGITAISQSPISSLGGTNVNVAVTGSQLATSIGVSSTQADAIVSPSGIQLTGSINSVSVDLNTPVNVTGSQLSFNQGQEVVSFTALADAQLSNTQSKFGGTSLKLDGSGDRIQSSDIELGTSSYTWETFAYFNNFSSTQCIWDAGENVGASQNPVVYITSTNLQLSYAGGTYINAAHGMSSGQWHHIAIVRNGTQLQAFIDGTSIGTATYAQGSGATNHVLGGNFAGTFTMDGFLDESRLTRDVVYTSNFTPPTSPFTPSQDDYWVLHYDGANGSTTIVNSAVPRVVTVTADANVSVTGSQADFTIGTFSISANGNISVVVTEHDLTTATGSVTTTADANVSVTGIQGTLALGEETIDVNTPVDVTGISATMSIGTAVLVPSVEVAVTGIELTTAVNDPLITAWSNVDPGVTNTWTEVNEGVSNTWTEVDIAA